MPNFEIMSSYPLDKLIPVVEWLTTTDLSVYTGDNSGRGYGFQFAGSVFIPFTRYLERLDYRESQEWTDFCERIFPLIDYMREQISILRGVEYKQRVAEINILPPGIKILPHVDKHTNSDILERVHLVLYTNADALFTIDGQSVHFPQGCCFVFNNLLLHDAANNSNTESRAHLVVDFEPVQW